MRSGAHGADVISQANFQRGRIHGGTFVRMVVVMSMLVHWFLRTTVQHFGRRKGKWIGRKCCSRSHRFRRIDNVLSSSFSPGSVGEKDFDALLVESVVTQHSVHGKQPVDFPLSAPLPIPSAGNENGLVASLEQSTPGLDHVLGAVASLVIGTERIANQFRRFVPRPQLRTRSQSFDVVAAQQSLLTLQRHLVLQVDQWQEIDVASVLALVAPVGGAGRGSPHHHPVGTPILEHLIDAFISI